MTIREVVFRVPCSVSVSVRAKLVKIASGVESVSSCCFLQLLLLLLLLLPLFAGIPFVPRTSDFLCCDH